MDYSRKDALGLIRQAGTGMVNATKPAGPPSPMQAPNGRPRERAGVPQIPPPVQLPNRGVAPQTSGVQSPGVVPAPPRFANYPGADDPRAPRFEDPNGGVAFNPLTGEWL